MIVLMTHAHTQPVSPFLMMHTFAHTHTGTHAIQRLCQMLHYVQNTLKIDDNDQHLPLMPHHTHTMKMNATIINLSDRNIWLSSVFVPPFISVHFVQWWEVDR